MSTEAPVRLSGYDAQNDSAQRSTLYFPTNSRVEYGSWTRRSLQLKHRALEANVAFLTRIKSKFGRHVVGKGIFPFPVTADAEWNDLNKAQFDRWASNRFAYSIDASRDLWEDQRIVAEELGAGDGETFTALINTTEHPATTQPLDPFEIGSLYGPLPGYEDGVKVDEFLRPLSYAVTELTSAISWGVKPREIFASDLIHVFRRRRAKQLRGLPPLYSAMNEAHDALDTLALAKAAAKMHSLLAVSKKKKQGVASQGITGQVAAVMQSDGMTVDHLEEKFKSAVTVDLGPDEELVLHASQRPTMAELDGIKFYCHLIALAADLPFSVVFSFLGVGGTATRADLEDAQNTFEMRQDHLISTHTHPIYVWRTALAMQTGELRACKDPYWWLCDYHGPAKITVDYGRSAAANIDLMKSGLLSAPRYYDERAQDAYSEGKKQIDWLAAMAEYADEKKVPFERFFEATPGASNGNQPPADPAATD